MTVRELLIRTRARLEVPERWTQRTVARCAEGLPVLSSAPDATCWCLDGALQAEAFAGDTPVEVWFPALEGARAILRSIAGGPITEWQDRVERTHADVLDLLSLGISACPEQAP